MPLREVVELDIRNAQNQLNQLETRFDQLRTPITIPVELTGEQAIANLRQQVAAVEQNDIDLDVNTFGLESADATFRDLNQQIDQTEDELQQAQRRADALGNELQETGRLGTTAFSGIRSAVGPLVATFAAGIGIREVVQQFNQAIDAATALTESMNAVEVVFGEGAAAIQQFGEDSAANVGLAASQVNQLVTPIGALLQNFGLDGREAAAAALELTNRAADLASVFNTDVNDALLAIGSALRGEQEPIRQFGVNLNAAALDAKALELGLVGVGEEVSQSVRGQAAYAELLEQTAFAAGDFAATSDSAANQQRTLAAAVEEARAGIGEALLPAFQRILDITPQVIGIFEQLIPTVETAADALASVGEDDGGFFEGVSDSVRVTQGLFDILGGIGGAAQQAFEVLFDLAQLDFTSVVQDIRDGGAAIDEMVNNLQFRGVEQGLVDLLRAGADPAQALTASLIVLDDAGNATADTIERLFDIGGLESDEFEELIRGLVVNARELGLSTPLLRILETTLADISTINFGGALVGFQNLSGGVNEAQITLDQFRGSIGAVFDEATAAETLEDAFGDLPTVVTNFADLQRELSNAGQSLNEFLTSSPDDSGIIGVFDDIETRALETLATLQEVAPELTGTLLGAFGDAPVDEETDKIEDDIESFFTFLDEKAGERAELEFDLAIIASKAPDLAQFLKDQGLAATDIAEAFAENLEDAAKAEALIDGTEGMAAEVAEQFAGFLETLTPEELANVAVFGAENFVSNPIRQQLQESASEMAQVLSDALAAETISPALTLDLSNVQITGAIDTGQIPVGPGGGTDTAPIGVQSVNVTINNPVTQDLDTSATQAAQTVGAVAFSLPRVE